MGKFFVVLIFKLDVACIPSPKLLWVIQDSYFGLKKKHFGRLVVVIQIRVVCGFTTKHDSEKCLLRKISQNVHFWYYTVIGRSLLFVLLLLLLCLHFLLDQKQKAISLLMLLLNFALQTSTFCNVKVLVNVNFFLWYAVR